MGAEISNAVGGGQTIGVLLGGLVGASSAAVMSGVSGNQLGENVLVAAMYGAMGAAVSMAAQSEQGLSQASTDVEEHTMVSEYSGVQGQVQRGLTSDELVQALHERFEGQVDSTRDEIATVSENELANNAGAYGLAKRNGNWAPYSNKCNCFVNNVLFEVGLDPNGTTFPRPPLAGELATGTNLPPDFALVPRHGPPIRGDIIAQQRAYGDATGHAAIMTSQTDLIEAHGYTGLRISTRAASFPANNPLGIGDVRFVRYSPENPWLLR